MAPDRRVASSTWTRIGSIAGALLFVILIVAITVGSEACSNKQFPFICLVNHLFGR